MRLIDADALMAQFPLTYIYNGCGQYGLARSYVVMAMKEVE